jgi:hypothetical protein
MNAILETLRMHYIRYIWYLRYNLGGYLLIVSESIINPVVSVTAFTWFITGNYHWNVQFLINVMKIISFVLCLEWPCCQRLWIVHSLLPLLFSLTFIFSNWHIHALVVRNNPPYATFSTGSQYLCTVQFNSNILLNKCINTISNGIAHQA